MTGHAECLPRSILIGPATTRTYRAMRRAVALAVRWRARIIILAPAPGAAATADILAAEEARLLRAIRKFLAPPRIRVEVAFGDVSVRDTVARAARLPGQSMLVAGPPTGSADDEIPLDAELDAALRNASLPVLVVRQRATACYERVLIVAEPSLLDASLIASCAGMFPTATLSILRPFRLPFPALLGGLISPEDMKDEEEEDLHDWIRKARLPPAILQRLRVHCEQGEMDKILARHVQPTSRTLVAAVMSRNIVRSLDLRASSGSSPFDPFLACDILLWPQARALTSRDSGRRSGTVGRSGPMTYRRRT